jgi:hypothetical protein
VHVAEICQRVRVAWEGIGLLWWQQAEASSNVILENREGGEGQ